MKSTKQIERRRRIRAALWRLVMTRPEILDVLADELADCLEEQAQHERAERRAQGRGEA